MTRVLARNLRTVTHNAGPHSSTSHYSRTAVNLNRYSLLMGETQKGVRGPRRQEARVFWDMTSFHGGHLFQATLAACRRVNRVRRSQARPCLLTATRSGALLDKVAISRSSPDRNPPSRSMSAARHDGHSPAWPMKADRRSHRAHGVRPSLPATAWIIGTASTSLRLPDHSRSTMVKLSRFPQPLPN